MEKDLLLTSKMDETVGLVLSSQTVQGFERGYIMAKGVKQLKELITPDYMRPIMELQGTRLGFKTDRDKEGGYAEAVVKTCVIEAVLTGVQLVGNQFNIIAGSCYITKEGFKYLLDKIEGLKYEIIPQLPRIKPDNTSAAVVVKIKWKREGGSWFEREIDIPIKIDKYASVDSVIGKCTRKARAWLYNTIKGTDIGDGDAEDKKTFDVSHKVVSKEEIEVERLKELLNQCSTIEEVNDIQSQCPEADVSVFDQRKEELKNGKNK